mmetsp:Transcript_29720/g.43246  ORF Transcript_29720/g.43246 Transcript_29720/m.43246 type:complete len:474 (-) Transcript_29720:930-2351(-)
MGCTLSAEATPPLPPTEDPDSGKHKVVIVGASFGGNGVIQGLLDGNDGEILSPSLHVTLLDANEEMSISAINQYVWTNRSSSTNNKVQSWPLSNLRAKRIVQDFRVGTAGTVQELNWDQKYLEMKDGKTIKWDTLVLAPGTVSDPSSVPGLDKAVGVIDLGASKDVSNMEKQMKKLLSNPCVPPRVVLVAVTRMPYKCPPMPFETVSLIDNVLRQAGEEVRQGVRVIISVPAEFPFGGPKVKEKFCKALKEMDIEFWPNHLITSMEHEQIVEDNDGDSVAASVSSMVHSHAYTVQFEVGEEKTEKSAEFDTLFCTFPQRAPDFVQKAGPCNKLGLIPVDLLTNGIEGHEDAYAIGDVCHTLLPKPNKPHPKAGEFAYMMGQQVAKHILARHDGKPEPAPQERKGKCVAEVGMKGNGIVVEPDFSAVLANPEEELPKFNVTEIGEAAVEKEAWINSYLERFFGKGNYELFVADN